MPRTCASDVPVTIPKNSGAEQTPRRSTPTGSTALRSSKASTTCDSTAGELWLVIATGFGVCSILVLVEHTPRADPRVRRDNRCDRSHQTLQRPVARHDLGAQLVREIRYVPMRDP